MTLVGDLLSSGAASATAICVGSTEVTYGELRDQVQRMAHLLLARGACRQDRVAIWAENGVFFVVGYFAVISAGLIAVPLPIDSSPEAAMRMITETGARTILVSRRYSDRVCRWAAEAGVAVVRETDVQKYRRLAEGSLPEIDPARDLAALMFTSGSTGTPKGVMVTHRNILCNSRDIVDYLGLSSSDRAMAVLPFSYCFGLSVLHTHLAVGGSLVINNQFMYPERVLREIKDRACTGLAGVPSTYQILLRKSRFTTADLSSLRWLQQAGGALPHACIQEILEAFPGVRFYVMYGQTEGTARLSYLPPERLRDKLGSIGKGLPSTRLEVLRPDGTPVAPGSAEVGEIVASGHNIAAGYWNDPLETARYFRGGRLYTGDMARVDVDGFIEIVERDREIIKCGGNRVSAQEVEGVIAELREVIEVAVVGMPHPMMGEAIVAFTAILPDNEKPAMNVLEHCRRRLPPSKVPEAIVYLARLPHTDSGKVRKTSLKEFAERLLTVPSADAIALQWTGDSLRTIGIEHRVRTAA